MRLICLFCPLRRADHETEEEAQAQQNEQNEWTFYDDVVSLPMTQPRSSSRLTA
jgi:hypothetical protein